MSSSMIDVSSNNHLNDEPINWSEVAKHGVKGVIIKATEGTDYVNPWLDRDAHGARAAGLHIGYYHFSQPGRGTAAEQAAYCLKAIDKLPRDWGVTNDQEVMNGLSWSELSVFAIQFRDFILQHDVAVSPLYSYRSYLADLSPEATKAPLWIASPGVRPRQVCWAWQSGGGIIPGIAGETDLDTYYGP